MVFDLARSRVNTVPRPKSESAAKYVSRFAAKAYSPFC